MKGAEKVETVVFCVETFWRASPTKLERGVLRQFGERQAAIEAAKVMARRRSGVLVYSVTGEPVADIWQAPRIIARYGDAPHAPNPPDAGS